jgi:hypothetical protein
MNGRPLESIRSVEIPDLINKIFLPIYENHWNKILYPYINSIILPAKFRSDENNVISMVKHAIELEEKYKDSENLIPTELNGIYKKSSDKITLDTDLWSDSDIKNLLGPINKSFIEKALGKLLKYYNRMQDSSSN